MSSAQQPSEVTLAQWLAVMRSRWRQGEHVALIGPTGRGKTTLGRSLLSLRRYVAVVAVKRDDATLALYRRGSAPYRVVRSWPPPWDAERVVYWARPRALDAIGEQQQQVAQALGAMYQAGGWTIALDDLSYLIEQLRLERLIAVLVNQGRSSGITVVSSVQRPRRVPLATLSQTRHLCMWRYGDAYDIDRVAELTGVSRGEMRALNQQLGSHDFVSVSSEYAPLIVRAEQQRG